ncbi:MAG: replicative DNA helicase [bacterium]
MGKTAFALNLASNVSINVPTLIFSLEMSSDQLMTRMVGLNCGIEQQKIKQGATTKEDMEIINEAWSEVITPRKMFIDDKAGLNISSMCSIARRMKKKEDIGLIIIDYLQLITTNNGFGSREQEVSHISRTLKALAKELNVPVVALSQLNRKLEERTCKRPKNSDLRESGSLEQDSDVIIFLYRDEVYNKSDENPEKGKAEIIISKQRNGPLGNVNLKFLETIGKFDNLDYF